MAKSLLELIFRYNQAVLDGKAESLDYHHNVAALHDALESDDEQMLIQKTLDLEIILEELGIL